MINLGKTGTLTAGALKGAGVLSEAWLNRRRLFAKYDTIYDTIAEIHQNLNSALETTPVHLALFDGDTSNKDVQASTGLIHIVSSFAGISGLRSPRSASTFWMPSSVRTRANSSISFLS
mgnify:CR=1 FL=1